MDRIEQLKQNVSQLKLKLTDTTLSHEAISQINSTIREQETEIRAIEIGGIQPKATIPGSSHFKSEIHGGWDGAGYRAISDKGGGQ